MDLNFIIYMRMTHFIVITDLTLVIQHYFTISKVSQKNYYTDIQKTEWSIGFRGSYLKKCNMFGIGKQIIDVMKLSPYGRKGINTYVSGTPTDYASVKKWAKKFLDNIEGIRTELIKRYGCEGASCETSGSSSATNTNNTVLSTSENDELSKKLIKIKKLLEQGLITEDEAAAKRKQILQDF